MIELFEKSGILTIGSRLRWLTEELTRDVSEIYKIYGLDIKPKWFPVLYMLYNGGDNTVTGIAKAIGQTHPSVSTIVREMKTAGLVSDAKSGDEQSGCRLLWDALGIWENSLSEKSLLDRVIAQKVNGESRRVEIVDYKPEYLMAFKRLNIMWINSHWSLEAHDLEVLNDPDGSILSKDGHILVALVDGKPMGVVALCRMYNPQYDYEVAKLAVDPEARGHGVGDAIFRAAIEKARSLGATRLFLESNTILKPAIGLYRKYGFTELKEYHTAYNRGDIQMELTL